MVYAVLIALWLVPHTRIVQLPDKEILRRGNFVVAATTDGYLCFGTKTPLSTECQPAVPEISDPESLPEGSQAVWWSSFIEDESHLWGIALGLLLLLGVSILLLRVKGIPFPVELSTRSSTESRLGSSMRLPRGL
jgi:hypothetical protein